MRSITEVLTETEELQDVSGQAGSRASIRDDTETDQSVDDEELERAYKNVPAVFNGINKIYQTIMSRDRNLVGENTEFFRDWLGNVGEIGGKAPWSEIHSKSYKYMMIYGEAFIEIIRDDEGQGKPVDLAFVDPKKMDYARQGGTGSGVYGTGNDIALDEFQNPIGYVQEVDYYEGDMVDQIHEVPDEVALSNNEIYIPAESMVHLKMYETGDGFYPTGLVGPIHDDAERSYLLKQDYGDFAHQTLLPTRVSYVGDENHEPNPEQINEINNQMKDAKNSTEWTYPHYVDMEMLESENPQSMIDFFSHFNKEISAGLGVANAIVMGQGEDVNRATLRIQDRMFQISLRDIIQRTSRNIESQLFDEIVKGYDEIDEAPDIEFNTNVPLGIGQEMDMDSIQSNSGEHLTKRSDVDEQ